jgi:hypothetical protein
MKSYLPSLTLFGTINILSPEAVHVPTHFPHQGARGSACSNSELKKSQKGN